MNWQSVVQGLNFTLGICLIVKLVSTKLYKSYLLFSLFLITDLLGAALWVLSLVLKSLPDNFYVLAWLITRPVTWLFTLLMVYSLLEKILLHLPGLLRLSKQVLHVIFFLAITTGLLSIRLEYTAPGFTVYSGKGVLAGYWMMALVFDRAIASTALLSLIAMLMFLLWFPVSIPRNLAIFSIGFTVYFVAKTILMLVRSFWPNGALPVLAQVLQAINGLIGIITGLCFAFWLFSISSAGEVDSGLTIQRRPEEQERLITQLELINDSLLKAARR